MLVSPSSPPHHTWQAALFALSLAVGIAVGTDAPNGVAQSNISDCVLEPLTLPLFDATPAAEIAATPIAPSTLADTSDEAILAAVEDIVACVNTGDPALQYAIFTRQYLARQFADPSLTYQPAFEQHLSLGPSGVEPSFELLGVNNLTVFESNLVSVTIELSGGGITYRDTLILANVDGVWLIDSIEELDPPQ